MQAGLRRNDDGGGIPAFAGRFRTSSAACSRPACGRQAPFYHGPVFGELSGSAEFAEDRTAELTERPASVQARP